MQLVIEISDGLYNNLGTIKNGSIASKIILDCVRKGQVLPKGHGRIADVDKMLDEIRAEIEEQVLESLSDGGDDWFTAEKVNECLEIIDKYKAESEVKE